MYIFSLRRFNFMLLSVVSLKICYSCIFLSHSVCFCFVIQLLLLSLSVIFYYVCELFFPFQLMFVFVERKPLVLMSELLFKQEANDLVVFTIAFQLSQIRKKPYCICQENCQEKNIKYINIFNMFDN